MKVKMLWVVFILCLIYWVWLTVKLDYEVPGYEIEQFLGKGSYSSVFKARRKSDGQYYALKIGHGKDNDTLFHEHEIYRSLKGVRSVPKVHDFFDDEENPCLVMDLLGPSLYDLRKNMFFKNNWRRVAKVFKMAVRALEELHNQGYLHRDIKPDNIVLDKFDDHLSGKLYLIDLNLSKKYIKNSRHIREEITGCFTGSWPYTSFWIHEGYRASRRDDLCSLVYTMLSLYMGKLPWSKFEGSKEHKNRFYYQEKKRFAWDRLRAPPQFYMIYNYCNSLEFTETPDYDYLIELLNASLRE